jgi:ribose transport system permease protein
MTAFASPSAAGSGFLAGIVRYAAVIALLLIVALFSLTIPTFSTVENLKGLLTNNFALLAIVSIGMTFVVAGGGIDLSIGTAIDFASLAFVSLVLGGYSVWFAAPAGLAAGAVVGIFNAILISGLAISPFLATLGTLFIGRSAQQLLTGGGNPIYLPSSAVPPSFAFLGHGAILGVPLAIVVVLALALTASIILSGTRFGREILAIGVQRSVAWRSGLRVSRVVALVYVLSALISAVAGLIISATVNVYVPYSGNAFLLNAIGATFIGATLGRNMRPNVPGAMIGVLLLGVVANGLLLSGLSFYWQQVGTGLLIFVVLAASFAKSRAA